MIVPRREVVGQRVVPISTISHSPSNLKTRLTRWFFGISHNDDEAHLVRMRFGNNTKRAHNPGYETGSESRSGTCLNHLGDRFIDELMVLQCWFRVRDLFSVAVSHTRSYLLSIHPIAHLFLTIVLQNDAHLDMLSVGMGSEPAVS